MTHAQYGVVNLNYCWVKMDIAVSLKLSLHLESLPLPVTFLCSECFCRHCRADLMVRHNPWWLFFFFSFSTQWNLSSHFRYSSRSVTTAVQLCSNKNILGLWEANMNTDVYFWCTVPTQTRFFVWGPLSFLVYIRGVKQSVGASLTDFYLLAYSCIFCSVEKLGHI